MLGKRWVSGINIGTIGILLSRNCEVLSSEARAQVGKRGVQVGEVGGSVGWAKMEQLIRDKAGSVSE